MSRSLALDECGEPAAGRRQRFADTARAAGMDPDDRWVGGYVDYEWEHLRPLLAHYAIEPEGRRALEFGCNVGASGVVLARLGAQVTGVDVDAAHVAVAAANFALHDQEDRARALHVPDTRDLPFDDGSFDFVIANSVLEYVDPAHLGGVIAELARVVRPGGVLFVCGTASRIAPREVHSRRWLVNYLPRAFDRMAGTDLQRGLSPRLLARCLAGRFAVESPEAWLEARRVIHGRVSPAMHALAMVAGLAGIAPGWLSNNIELKLRRC